MKSIIAAAATCVALAVAVPPALAAGPTDPQIAAIVVTANRVDIDAGKLAESKGHSTEVKEFAERMITDHTAVNKAAGDLAHKLNVTPEPGATSEALQKGGDENIANLKKLSGAGFDKAYIDHEIAYHQAVIDALDKTLIPSAQNAELKALLVKTRPAFVEHLDHAKKVQEDLAKGS